MITYYIQGYSPFLGNLRTISTTSTIDEFLKYLGSQSFKYNDEQKVYRSDYTNPHNGKSGHARVIIEKLEDPDMILPELKIGV